MGEPAKGTVTSLSSMFPADEAQKASKRVQDTIAERRKELGQLREFISDNAALVNLVQKLPDELHHDIMVPFGKAAFFPGRLIHTNEFLVLLGEGYYAERTSKQTTEILKRRGNALESQVQSLKVVMQDLNAEASFFDATAAEAADGLMEIREEYIEENSAEVVSKAGPAKLDSSSFSKADSTRDVIQDEEYTRMLSRIDELEKEELAAESINEGDEDEEYSQMMSGLDELEKKDLVAESVNEYDEDVHAKADFGLYKSQHPSDLKHISSELEGLKMRSVSEDKSSGDQSLALNKSSSAEKAPVLPEVKENVLAEPQSKNKAFTGLIVEHTHNIETNPREQTATSAKPATLQSSKPVSRFKMQRR